MPRVNGAVSLGIEGSALERGAAMIDFSDQEEIKRWLDAIEPAGRRREVAVALAARAAHARSARCWLPRFVVGPGNKSEILSAVSLVRICAPSLCHGSQQISCPKAFALAPPTPLTLPPASAADTEAFDFAAAQAARAAEAASAVSMPSCATDFAYAARRRLRRRRRFRRSIDVDLAFDAAAAAADFDANVAIAAASHHASDAADADAIDFGRSAAELAGSPFGGERSPIGRVDAWRTLKSELLRPTKLGRLDRLVWARLAGDAPIRRTKRSKSPAR